LAEPLLPRINQKRIESHFERRESPLRPSDIGYNYTVLSSCFLPYRDPKTAHWERRNGRYSLILTAGAIHHPDNPGELLELGLPFGPKPRLFLAFVNSLSVKRQNPVVPIGNSMTGMLKELGFPPTGGIKGTIYSFKNQVMRLASCNFTVVGPGPRGGETYTKAPPIRQFSVWIPPQAKKNVWPSELILTDEYFHSLLDHAVPYDVRALRTLQNNARAMDVFLWMSQRLPRLTKPLLMKWPDLFALFGGGMGVRSHRAFKKTFRQDALAARIAYGFCRMDETPEGFLCHWSPPSVPRKR
jgi:hypothetical protein